MSLPTYTNTFGWVIQYAYEAVGLIAEGTFPDSEKIAKGMNKLNQIVGYWMTKGLKLFAWSDRTVTLTSTNFYPMGPAQTGLSITPKPMKVEYAYFVQASSGSQVPLTEVSWQEWTTLPITSSSPGQPVNYRQDKQATYLGLYLWPTPDSTSQLGSLHVVLRTQITPGETYTVATGFPQEWQLPLTWFLAEELSIGQPLPIVQMCRAKAKEYREDCEGWDVEDAQTFFTPDTRGSFYGNSFS